MGLQEDIFYYLTLYNENQPVPPVPDGAAEGVVEGMCRYFGPTRQHSRRVSLLFSGSASRAVLEARDLLVERWGVDADVWSVTSYERLREEALSVDRWNRQRARGQSPRNR